MNVLCVCKGNTCRSPMMEKLLQSKLDASHSVESAGVLEVARNGNPASEGSIAAMGMIGFDLSGHRSKYVGDLNLAQFDHFLCVGHEEADIIAQLSGTSTDNISVLNIPNPWQQPQEAYDECLRAIIEATDSWLEQ